jgi:hypothetical protein
MMVFSPHVPPEPGDSPEIRAVLRVAFENLLLSTGGHAEATEITGDDATLSILRTKGHRLGYSHHAFTQIQKISGVPDLGVAFASRKLSSTQLMDLRYSKHAKALRDWFALGAPSSTEEETVRRYVETIGQPGLVDSLPSKLLRFATTTGLGAIEPLSGAIASATDTFLLSKWFPGRSPRLFLKQAKVMLANTPAIQAPLMRGRDRNALCACGSGKKFKKCCSR